MTVWQGNNPIVWPVHDDGGRETAGYKGLTGDCAVRSIAIATERPYQEIYDRMNTFIQSYERKSRERRTRSSSRTGVYKATMRAFMDRELGWLWTPTMEIGTGCTVHVRADELPYDRLVLSLSGHYTAFINGQIRDTHDPSREGTRCVYGYWRAPTDIWRASIDIF
jgi:hypothetical protein